MSFNTPVASHGSSSSRHHVGSSKLTPTINASSPPRSKSSPSVDSASSKGLEGRIKEETSSVGEIVGDSSRGSETGELQSDYLQQLLEKQLTQQKQAAMTGLGKTNSNIELFDH